MGSNSIQRTSDTASTSPDNNKEHNMSATRSAQPKSSWRDFLLSLLSIFAVAAGAALIFSIGYSSRDIDVQKSFALGYDTRAAEEPEVAPADSTTPSTTTAPSMGILSERATFCKFDPVDSMLQEFILRTPNFMRSYTVSLKLVQRAQQIGYFFEGMQVQVDLQAGEVVGIYPMLDLDPNSSYYSPCPTDPYDQYGYSVPTYGK